VGRGNYGYMKERFKLYYKDIFIGTVLTGETDFFRISGTIEFNQDTLKKNKQLQDYVSFSIKASNKVLEEGNAYEEFLDKEESKYLSIIESADWTLVTMDGATKKIMVPVFFNDNKINFCFQ
jgi:hypothetical protein